jgi:uncharacterized protein YcfL
MKHIAFAAIASIALAACSSTQQSQTVAGAEVALTAAEAAAFQYVTLPVCPASNGTLCSNPAISAQIKAADNVAFAAVKSAEAGSGSVATAMAAIASLSSVIPTTPAK